MTKTWKEQKEEALLTGEKLPRNQPNPRQGRHDEAPIKVEHAVKREELDKRTGTK